MFLVPMKPLRTVFGMFAYTSSDDPDTIVPCRISEKKHKLKDNYKITLDRFIDSEILDRFIDSEINLLENSKFEKKIQKMCVNNIVFGVPNSGKYHTVNFSKPLVELPKTQLLITLQRIKRESFKEGYKFINDFSKLDISDFALKQMEI